MPWSTPTLKDVRSLVRDHIRGALPGADATIPNSVLRVLSDVQGAVCHLTLQYEDWQALQLIPDTAEHEWLDRHGDIWLVNSDGSTGRKMATLSAGSATFTGTGGSIVPAGARLSSGSGFEYETLSDIVIDASVPTPGPIRALDPGAGGNVIEGTALAMFSTPPGVSNAATVVFLDGGTDEENDDDLRARVLLRIRQPPMGGAAHDYVQWSLAVPGVTRAWCSPNEMGIGTVSVRIMCDVLRADNDGFPNENDIARTTAYLDQVRPVAVKDFWVLAPIKQFIDVHVANLTPDTPETRAQCEAALLQMLLGLAAPGQTIYAAWKYYAIMSEPNITSFDIVDAIDDVMPSVGHMAVLGDIFYE